MALIFREVNNIMWWDPLRSHTEDWLQESDVRGDALKSLNSKENALSVYVLDEEGQSLERVLAAFAAQRERLDKVDFALLAVEQLEQYGFALEVLEGRTPDSMVNSWHRDLIRLSGARILSLAERLQFEAAFCRRRKPQVKQLIKDGITAGWIDTKKMNVELVREVMF